MASRWMQAKRAKMARDLKLRLAEPGNEPSKHQLRRTADVMLVVGSRVGNLDVPFDKYWGDPAKCRVSHVDVDPRHIGVSRPVTLGIVADAPAWRSRD